MSELDDVCVVSHSIESAATSHAETLLNILDALTTVSVVALSISERSDIPERYDAITVSEEGTHNSIVAAAVFFLVYQIRIARILSRRPEQMVLFFGTTSYLLPILVAKLIGKTVVLLPRGNVPLTLQLHWEKKVPAPIARGLAGLLWSIERVGYWVADAIITYTPSMAEELGLRRFEEKLHPNGARYVNTEMFYPRVPFEERENVVGFLGRLDEEKNVRMLAEVTKELPESMVFRFIGDGPLREELERELADEVRAGQVEFRGWVDHDDVPAELSELRLLVLPSEPTEGLPTVILESMACGTPVLATPVSGVPDVIQEGETGFLMVLDSIEVTKKAILSSMLQPNSEHIHQNCRQIVESSYTFDSAVRRYRSIFIDIN